MKIELFKALCSAEPIVEECSTKLFGCLEHNGEVNYCDSCLFSINNCPHSYKAKLEFVKNGGENDDLLCK